MKIAINIECINAAFEDADRPEDELARILEELATKLRNVDANDMSEKVRDINGNPVGSFQVKTY